MREEGRRKKEEGKMWQELLKTAILGTEKYKLYLTQFDNQLGEVLNRLDVSDVEGSLLAASGTLALYQRGGKLCVSHKQTQDKAWCQGCELDDLPYCGAGVGEHFGLMLNGKYSELLPEWLTALKESGKLIHPIYLPDILTLGLRRHNLREAILLVLGKRGFWLAALNPEWNYVISEYTVKDWVTISTDTKILVLKKLRATDREAALNQLQSVWKKETVEMRASLLETLEVALSIEDEPFLEAALDDKRKQVRDVAARLLAKLPESRLVQRMIQRVIDLIQFTGREVRVIYPKESTREMMRDGVNEAKYNSDFVDKANLLLQMLSCVPPSFWSQTWGKTPLELVGIVDGSEWERLMITGWSQAAVQYQDVDWGEAVVLAIAKGMGQKWNTFSCSELLGILPQVRREQLISRCFTEKPEPWSRNAGYTLLSECKYFWSEEFSRLVLEHLCNAVCSEEQGGNIGYASRWLEGLKKLYPYFMNTSVYEEAVLRLSEYRESSYWGESVNIFLDILGFRFEMHKAIHN
jgi:Family of unknown function (DUF5691)